MSPFGDFFAQKNHCVQRHSDKGGGPLYINFEKLCPSLYIYTCQSTLSNTAIQQGRNEGGKSKGHMSYPAELPSNFAKVLNNTIS